MHLSSTQFDILSTNDVISVLESKRITWGEYDKLPLFSAEQSAV